MSSAWNSAALCESSTRSTLKGASRRTSSTHCASTSRGSAANFSQQLSSRLSRIEGGDTAGVGSISSWPKLIRSLSSYRMRMPATNLTPLGLVNSLAASTLPTGNPGSWPLNMGSPSVLISAIRSEGSAPPTGSPSGPGASVQNTALAIFPKVWPLEYSAFARSTQAEASGVSFTRPLIIFPHSEI